MELDQAVMQSIDGWLEDREKLETTLLPPKARIAERSNLIAAARRLVDELKQCGKISSPIVNLLDRIELSPDEFRITLDQHLLREALKMLTGANAEMGNIVIVAPIALKRRGVEARLVIGGDNTSSAKPDTSLIAVIASARNWFSELQSGEVKSVVELSVRHKVDRSHVSRILPLAFLAPDIVAAIIDGRTEPNLTLSYIKRLKLPASWQAQRKLLGIQ